MPKSMAIEGVMKLFLMIAVIIVGMSFLLKAFGIDLFGWLEEKFRGFNIPNGGKALHIVIDVADKEIWEFHVTDGESSNNYKGIFGESENKRVHTSNADSTEEGFYIMQNMPTDRCLIFATDEESGKGVSDVGYIYYVKSGAIIDKEKCNSNIRDCIGDFIYPKADFSTTFQGCRNLWGISGRDFLNDNNCLFVGSCGPENSPDICKKFSKKNPPNPNHNCFPDSTYYITNQKTSIDANLVAPRCDENADVITFQFSSSQIYKWSGKCKKGSKDCILLEQEEKTYQIKYGLICETTPTGAKWKVCKQSDRPLTANVDGNTFTCDFNGDRGAWQ